MLRLSWGAGTDRGLRRARNEDAFHADPPIFVVADGMGGHHRGDVAAAIAVESLRDIGRGLPSRSELLDAVRLAHEAITQIGVEQASEGMGTTLCGMATTSEGELETLLVFNVGDSRVYRCTGQVLVQLTKDHSVVQELLDDGTISEAEVATHPERHVVTRSLGSGGPLEIDWWSVEPVVGDRYLLCSDGLVKEVPRIEIEEVLNGVPTPQAAADQLLAAALAGGGRDNVTVVVVDVVALDGPSDASLLEPETQPRHLAGVAARPEPSASQP